MLYIMRHGKTDWNETHRLQGRTDIPLNDTGRAMARAAGKEYQNINLDICYCSPLARARETAELVLQNRDIPIVFDDRLQEMKFGICEGVEIAFEKEDDPIHVFFHAPSQYVAVEGGESFEELFARTGSFLKEIIMPALEENKDILIVGHGAVNSSIACQIKDIPLDRFWETGIENCKLIELLP